MEDITPRLIEDITGEFRQLYDGSEKIAALLAKVKTGAATYGEAQEYAIEVSRLIGQAWQKYVSSETLPDGRMYYNIASRLIPATLSENHNLVSDFAARVQEALNLNAGLGLKAQATPLDADRVDGLVEFVSNADKYDQVEIAFLSAEENFSQNIVDETIRRNAEFHYHAGLHPKIIRRSNGKCCRWCSSLAGVYDYPLDDTEVYRRHTNCRCTVLYDPADGSKLLQDVHSRKKVSAAQNVASYQEKEKHRRTEEAAKKFKRTFQAVPESRVVDVLRSDCEQWIAGLSETEKRSIQKYSGNGDKSPKFYERLNAMLRGEALDDESLRTHASIISGALKRSILEHNVICYRGQKTNPLAGVQVGSFVSLKQFTSTSAINTKAFKSNVQMIIYAKAGTKGVAYIESLSQFANQREILFDKDCWYRVLSNQENLIELEAL